MQKRKIEDGSYNSQIEKPRSAGLSYITKEICATYYKAFSIARKSLQPIFLYR
jgi:hypothetical protein